MVLLDQCLPHSKRLNIRSMTLELQKKKSVIFQRPLYQENKVFLTKIWTKKTRAQEFEIPRVAFG